MRGTTTSRERAECNACAYGVDAQRRIVFDKGEQGFHQIAVLSLECRLYVRQYFQHGNGAQHHHACRNEVHFAPTQHFADKPADDARGEYAVSRPDMTMPTLRPLFSGRENWEAIGTKICGIMEQIPVMSEAPHMM